MKGKHKNQLRIINLLALLSIAVTCLLQVSFGVTEILAAPNTLNLSSKEDLSQLRVDDEFLITISDTRDARERISSEEPNLPLANKFSEIDTLDTSQLSQAKTKTWHLKLPEGINFDEDKENDLLKETIAAADKPSYKFNEETRELAISVGESFTELDLVLTAATQGEYQLIVSDEKMLSQSVPLDLVVAEKEITDEEAVIDSEVVTPSNMNQPGPQAATTGPTNPDFDKWVTNPPLDKQYFGSTQSGGSSKSDEEYFESREVVPKDNFTNDQIASVWNEAQLVAAFRNPQILYISIEADMMFTSSDSNSNPNTNEGGNDNNITGADSWAARNLVIDGNNHVLDSRSTSYWFYGNSGSGKKMNLTVQNLTAFAGNWYGPFRVVNYGVQTFHNFTNIGTQMLYSLDATVSNVYLSGDITNYYVRSYTSPIDGKIWYPRTYDQANFQIRSLTMSSGATFYGNQHDSGAFHIYGSLNMKKGSEVVLDSRTAKNTTHAGENGGSVIRLEGSSANPANLIMDEESKLTIHQGVNRKLYGSIRLQNANSKFIIGKNAEVNIYEDGHSSGNGADYNTIYLDDNSIFKVESGGIFNIESTNRTNSANGAIVNAGGGSSFTVDPNGVFNVTSSVPSTTRDASIIYFRSKGNFVFADAKRVNLQFDNKPSNTSQLINMAGDQGIWQVDVQRVKGWLPKATTAEILDDNTPDFNWGPMFGMYIRYYEFRVYRQFMKARSTNAAVLDEFYRNFDKGRGTRNDIYNRHPVTNEQLTTTGFQRLLFEFIPDVQVSIDEEVNDKIPEISAKRVTGTTNPGALVRISDTPGAGSSKAPVLTDSLNTVPSPVTGVGNDDETTKNFTTIANDKGEYFFDLPGDLYFDAGSTINVYSFKEGKSDRATAIVEDRVAPEANVADHTTFFNVVPTPDNFVDVDTITDTNPTLNLKTDIKREFDQATTSAAIYDWLIKGSGDGPVGTHKVGIKLSDPNGNFTLYKVNLAIQGYTKTLTVNMVNEDGKPIDSNIVPDKKVSYQVEVGEASDSLLLNSTDAAGLRNFIEEIIKTGYYKAADDNWASNALSYDVANKPQTVTFAFKGVLKFKDVTDKINFGSTDVSFIDQTIKPTTDFAMDVVDTRAVTAGGGGTWDITAKMAADFTDGSKTLENILYFQGATGQPIPISNSTATKVYGEKNSSAAPVPVTKKLTWSAAGDVGLRLILPSSQATVGTYTGTIEWGLDDTY